jgi:hypothetical protein
MLPHVAAGFALGWCGFAFAAEPQEPQLLPSEAAARPIDEAETPVTNTLRWKSKPLPTAVETQAAAVTSQPIADNAPTPIRAGWNITRIDPSVRPVQHTASDPFKDPFGDRQTENSLRTVSETNSTQNAAATGREPLLLQPTQAEVGIEELPPPRQSTPMASRPLTPSREMTRMTAAQPGGGIPADPGRISPMPGTLAPLPGVGAPPLRKSVTPCNRNYNGRNCCDLEVNCHAFRDQLLADTLAHVSLDITPRYNPDLTPEEDEADRRDRLGRELDIRIWKNRRGETIGTGKMLNLQNNAVVIADETGREIGRLPIGELGEDEMCYVTAFWRLPSECLVGGVRNVSRNWIPGTFVYHASALCHKPLYFEEVQLERYGHTAGPLRQPIISGAHFILNLATLPYQMGINPPTECQYALGYYRPGSCAPWMIQPIPLSLRGATAEVGAALGMVFLIP